MHTVQGVAVHLVCKLAETPASRFCLNVQSTLDKVRQYKHDRHLAFQQARVKSWPSCHL